MSWVVVSWVVRCCCSELGGSELGGSELGGQVLLKNGDGTSLHWWLEGTFTAQVVSHCSSWMRDTERRTGRHTPRCVTGRRTKSRTERRTKSH